MNVTFDTNCIIDLEEDRPRARYVRRIVQSATEQGLELRVVAISASEKPPHGKEASIREFKAKLARAGLQGVEILKPPGIWDVTYWDYCIWGSKEFSAERRRIHEILFPTTPFGYGDYCRKFRVDPKERKVDERWLNCTIDSVILWTHNHNGGGVFVTSDGNFFDHKERLARLVSGEILKPEEAAARFCPD